MTPDRTVTPIGVTLSRDEDKQAWETLKGLNPAIKKLDVWRAGIEALLKKHKKQ